MLVLARLAHFEGFPSITIGYDLLFTEIFFALSRFGALGLKTNASAEHEQITPLAYLHQNWKKWLTEGVIYYGVVGSGLALYMLSNKVLFGTFSPVSGQIKRWWGTLAGRVTKASKTETRSAAISQGIFSRFVSSINSV